MISWTLDRAQLGGASAVLDRLSKALRDLTHVMDAIGAYAVSSTQRRFETKIAPDGTPWKPSIRVLLFGGETMKLSGQLKASIAHAPGRDQVEIGSNKVYAGIQQLGGTIHARNADNLTFRIGPRWISKPSVTIPARPFLGLDDRDRAEIEDIASLALEQSAKGQQT